MAKRYPNSPKNHPVKKKNKKIKKKKKKKKAATPMRKFGKSSSGVKRTSPGLVF